MEIVAEGVETQQQAEFLNTIGCQAAQGFFYSRAIAAGDVDAAMSTARAALTQQGAFSAAPIDVLATRKRSAR